MTQPPPWRRPGMSGSFPSVPRQIFRNDYFSIFVEDRLGLVRTIRSSKPFASIPEMEAILMEFGDALDALGRAHHVLLADIRAAPGRNDPPFEAAAQRLRPRWAGGFRKAGVLVQSVAGMLQMKRYVKQDGVDMLVSSDEDELLKYLLSREG